MTMSMYKSICITNRHLVKGDFLRQLQTVLHRQCDEIILREKDLSEEEYETLARQVLSITKNSPVSCTLHTYVDVAIRLGVPSIHLPFSMLESMTAKQKQSFTSIGVSVHSTAEADTAWKAGATYLIAGHIFTTDCKKDVPPRGLDFLKEVCGCVPIPVYAIGGICKTNIPDCIHAGAAGICMMSDYMIPESKGHTFHTRIKKNNFGNCKT